jgi:DNA-binding XRE family transcriptional regulator
MQKHKDYFEMTQKEVADAMGVTRGTIGQIEKEAIEKLKRILAERGIDVKELLEDE